MIDWTKPIELDTVPPRPARVDCVGGNGRARIEADFHGEGLPSFIWVSPETGLSYDVLQTLPHVRNVAAPDIAAELAEALRALIDAPEPDCIPSRKWDNARAAIAKYEASK